MKKLIVIALMMTGIASFAQHGEGRRHENLTTEQRNELRLKKMTLDLDLNASQQKEVAKIISEQSAKRESMVTERKARKEKGTKPTAEQRYAMENRMLDEQIAMKGRMKKILTAEQFDKWEKGKERKKEHAQKKLAQHKGVKSRR
ncbi:MAG TPA: hypothetical protein VGB50_03770 [Flavobacterium sp.]|jgi:hypothetical protein